MNTGSSITRRILGWLRCQGRGHDWVRPPHHGHLANLGLTLEEGLARPVCKGSCVRCGKSDCRWDRR